MLNTAGYQVSNYSINTPVYEGPLDLLLQLIEKAELDITRLALAQVTDQYLDHIHRLPAMAADEVSAFLVIAARLLQIKSEALLPRPPSREAGELDPGEALARQLLAYKRYREIAGLLNQREASGQRTYLRLAPPPKADSILDMSGMGLPDLLAAALAIFSKADVMPSLSSVVAPPRVTIRQKINLLTDILRAEKKVRFSSLINEKQSRLEVVVTFLAVLELIKRHLVIVEQADLFGEIAIEMSEHWSDEQILEIEFGE